MIDLPIIVQTSRQFTAVIHLTIPREEIRHVMGPALSEVMATVAAQGLTPSGPWFTQHFKMDPKTFDFEVGVPVSRPITPAGRVTNSELAPVTAARALYRGNYEGLPMAWPELDAWIAAQGRKPGPSLREAYLVDPSTNPDPASWQTELTRPID